MNYLKIVKLELCEYKWFLFHFQEESKSPGFNIQYTCLVLKDDTRDCLTPQPPLSLPVIVINHHTNCHKFVVDAVLSQGSFLCYGLTKLNALDFSDL